MLMGMVSAVRRIDAATGVVEVEREVEEVE